MRSIADDRRSESRRDPARLTLPRVADAVCPGCGLRMPHRPGLPYDGYYHASPECWSVYTEVLAAEYSHAVLWGQVHQLTVDTYAVQHAGRSHPDKSVDIHLAGLHLAFVRGIRSPNIAPMLQRLAASKPAWPHFEPPRVDWPLTVCDVALVAGEFDAHIRAVRAWSATVWHAWSAHHASIAALVERHAGGTVEV
jgi:hypothetical protein